MYTLESLQWINHYLVEANQLQTFMVVLFKLQGGKEVKLYHLLEDVF